MRSTVNRLMLGLTGLVLLGVGLAVLAGGLGHWPYGSAHDVLLSATARRRYRGERWWWPTVIGVLGIVVLVALWWLLAQFRDRRIRRIQVEGGDSGDGQGVVLRGRALENIVAAEAESLPGVAHAQAALTTPRDAPTVRLLLALAPHADPGALLTELDTYVLERARTSAALPALAAEARLRAVSHRASRVS
jgi:hypothetical protein